MNNTLYSIIGILIPFIGTSFGSSFVLFLKKNLNEKIQKLIVGFAAGVMIAASIWSLILPSAELAEEQGIINWIPAAVGFILGIIFLIITNYIANKLAEKRNGRKLNMLMFSVTLHNIPEGMAVRCLFCRIFSWKYRYNINFSNGFIYRNSAPKYTGRCNNFYTTKITRDEQRKSIIIWNNVRYSRTNSCGNYNPVT